MSQNRSEINCSLCGGKQKPLATYAKTAEFPKGDPNQPICVPCYHKGRNSWPKVTRMKRAASAVLRCLPEILGGYR